MPGLSPALTTPVITAGRTPAIAVLGVLMLTVFNRTLTSSLAESDLDSETRLEIDSQREKLAAIEVPQHIESEQRAKIEKAIDESFLGGFRIVMSVDRFSLF